MIAAQALSKNGQEQVRPRPVLVRMCHMTGDRAGHLQPCSMTNRSTGMHYLHPVLRDTRHEIGQVA